MRYKTTLLLSACTSLFASDYTFVDMNSPWHFGYELDPNPKARHWHLDTSFSTVGEAKVRTTEAKGTHIKNTNAMASIYYSHFINEKHALAFQLGYNFMRFDWPGNPRFSQKDFHYGIASLAWVSHGIEDWRWVVMGGVTASLQVEFSKSAVGYGLLWGRYVWEIPFGIHIGFFGYAGAQNGLLLPILGFDWDINSKWKIYAIAPLELSLDYNFNKRWSASASYTTFGGPYRFPWRYKGGKEGFEDGIFKFFSRGVDLSLNYVYETILEARVAGGYNFGGWAEIKNKHDRRTRYYKYDGAPYVIGEFSVTF